MNENKDKRGEGEEREGEERGGERREGGRTAPDDVGQFLSAEDETRMRNFVTEFVAQRLVPHLEAVLKNLNEWVSPSIHTLLLPLLCTYILLRLFRWNYCLYCVHTYTTESTLLCTCIHTFIHNM